MKNDGCGGSDGGDQQPLPPPPCGACGHRGTACGPHCVFAPFFPPHSEADFASVRSMYSLERIIQIITTLQPEVGQATVRFMIRDSRAQANNAVPSHFHHLISAAMLLTDLLLLMPELQRLAAIVDQRRPEPAPQYSIHAANRCRYPKCSGGGRCGRDFGDPRDLLIRRGEPAEIAERSFQVEASSSAANVYLSAPTVFDGDDDQ